MIAVDTSVAIKWLNKEEKDSELAYLLYKNHIAGTERIVIPPLLFIEAANTLATKSNSTKEDIKTGLEFLFEADFTLHNVVLEEWWMREFLLKNTTRLSTICFTRLSQGTKSVF